MAVKVMQQVSTVIVILVLQLNIPNSDKVLPFSLLEMDEDIHNEVLPFTKFTTESKSTRLQNVLSQENN